MERFLKHSEKTNITNQKEIKTHTVFILECQFFPPTFCWMRRVKFAVCVQRLTLKSRPADLVQAATSQVALLSNAVASCSSLQEPTPLTLAFT